MLNVRKSGDHFEAVYKIFEWGCEHKIASGTTARDAVMNLLQAMFEDMKSTALLYGKAIDDAKDWFTWN